MLGLCSIHLNRIHKRGKNNNCSNNNVERLICVFGLVILKRRRFFSSAFIWVRLASWYQMIVLKYFLFLFNSSSEFCSMLGHLNEIYKMNVKLENWSSTLNIHNAFSEVNKRKHNAIWNIRPCGMFNVYAAIVVLCYSFFSPFFHFSLSLSRSLVLFFFLCINSGFPL